MLIKVKEMNRDNTHDQSELSDEKNHDVFRMKVMAKGMVMETAAAHLSSVLGAGK